MCVKILTKFVRICIIKNDLLEREIE